MIFLYNTSLQEIQYYDWKYTHIQWDFLWIVSIIEKKCVPVILPDNTFLLWAWNNRKIHDNKDIVIHDWYRKITFIIKPIVQKEYGIEKIINILFSSISNFFHGGKIQSSDYHIAYEQPSQNNTQESFSVSYIQQHNKVHISSWEELLSYSIFTQKITYDDIWFYTYKSFTPRILTWYDHTIDHAWSGTRTLSDKAEQVALSEAVERLCATTHNPPSSTLINTTNRDNYSQKLSNNYHKNFNQIEWPNELHCYKGKNILDTSQVSIPHEALYFPTTINTNHTDYNSNSSGMATHISKNDAILTWLCELIERDACALARFLKAWRNRLHENIYTNIVEKSYFHAIEYIKQFATVDFFIISLDNPLPVVVGTLRWKTWSQINIVSACWLSLAEAIQWCLHQCITSLHKYTTDEYVASTFWPNYHVIYYDIPEHYNQISRLWDIQPSDTLPEQILTNNEWLDEILNRYKTNKPEYQFYYYQYDHPLNNIYKRVTVKVLSDSLVPLVIWQNSTTIYHRHPRLHQLQKEYKIDTLNPYLSPFW